MPMYEEPTLTKLFETLESLSEEEEWHNRPELSVLIMRQSDRSQDKFVAFVGSRYNSLFTVTPEYCSLSCTIVSEGEKQ